MGYTIPLLKLVRITIMVEMFLFQNTMQTVQPVKKEKTTKMNLHY